MEYEVLPHTADLRIRIQSKTLEELFQNALLGLNHVLASDRPRGSSVRAEFLEILSSSATGLLIDFLNEVLYLSNVHKAVYDRVRFSKFSDTELAARLDGFGLDGFAEDVKAVTYHGAQIKKDRQGYYEVEIILDI